MGETGEPAERPAGRAEVGRGGLSRASNRPPGAQGT